MQQHTSFLEFAAGASGLIATLSLQHSQHPFQSIELYISMEVMSSMQCSQHVCSHQRPHGLGCLADTQVEIVSAQRFNLLFCDCHL